MIFPSHQSDLQLNDSEIKESCSIKIDGAFNNLLEEADEPPN